LWVRLALTTPDDPDGFMPIEPPGEPFKIMVADAETGEWCHAGFHTARLPTG
jgi:hypothetical protein